MIQDYNDLSTGLAMMNSEKGANAKATTVKKVSHSAAKVQKKADEDTEEASKWNELRPGFDKELSTKGLDGILCLPDSWLWQYIYFFFQKKVVNLSKTKKADLKLILSPLLEDHFETIKATSELVIKMTEVDAAVSASAE